MLSRTDERGFTLAELAVAMTLLLLVSGALLGALESGTNAERHASTRIDDEQSLRLVLAQFTRDVRNAAPQPGVSAWPLVAASPDSIQLTDAAGDALVWTYAATTHVLQRKFNNDAAVVMIAGLTNASGTVFQVLGPGGGDLFTDAGAQASTSDVERCGTTVTVSVTSGAHPPSAPFTETASAPLQAAGVDRRGCP